MKKILLSLLVLLTYAVNANAGHELNEERHYAHHNIPDSFKLKEPFISLKKTYHVYDLNDNRIGTVKSKILSLTATFKYYDRQGNIHAFAEARFFSWGTTVDVFDGDGNLIGIVKQKVLTLFPQFEIYDYTDRHIATAESNVWGNNYRVESRLTGAKLAEITRPWYYDWQFRSTWKIQSFPNHDLHENYIDPRLMMMTAVYRVYIEDVQAAMSDLFRKPTERCTERSLNEKEALLIKAYEQYAAASKPYKGLVTLSEISEQEADAVIQKLMEYIAESEDEAGEPEVPSGDKDLDQYIIDSMIRYYTLIFNVMHKVLNSTDFTEREKAVLVLLNDASMANFD